MRLKLERIIAISIVALGGTLVGSGATASAQTGAAFDYEPTEGPVDTVITITNGGCDSVQEAGDAIALYRASDGALVDATTQLGNDPANPRPWTTRLIVSPTLLTAAGTTEATTPGDYVVALFCDIGSSFRPPNDPNFPTSPGDADLTQPFVVTEPEPEPEPLPLGVTPTSGSVGTSVTVFGQGCVNEVGPGVVTVLLGGRGRQPAVRGGERPREWELVAGFHLAGKSRFWPPPTHRCLRVPCKRRRARLRRRRIQRNRRNDARAAPSPTGDPGHQAPYLHRLIPRRRTGSFAGRRQSEAPRFLAGGCAAPGRQALAPPAAPRPTVRGAPALGVVPLVRSRTITTPAVATPTDRRCPRLRHPCCRSSPMPAERPGLGQGSPPPSATTARCPFGCSP